MYIDTRKKTFFLKNWVKKKNAYLSIRKSELNLIFKKKKINFFFPKKTLLFFDKNLNFYLFYKQKKFYKKFYNFFNKSQKQFFYKINFTGIGFKCTQLTNQTLVFHLGYSHTIFCEFPNSINFKLIKDTELVLYSKNKQKLNEISKKIILLKMFKKPT